MINCSEIQDDIIRIAEKAGDAIMEIYQQDFSVLEKNDGSPLTLADQNAHNIIEQGLKGITPEIPVLSEESKERVFQERKSWSTFWLVDPLDGTKEFVKKNGEFTVNIALIHQGVPVFGVVYAPAIDTLWVGGVDVVAFKRVAKKTETLRKSTHRESIRVVASRSHGDSATSDFIAQIEKNSGLPIEFVSMGSSIKMCLVAEGSADLYPRLKPTSEWDTAAAHAIVIAMQGDIVDLDKNRLQYNKDNILNPYFVCYSATAPNWDAPKI